MPTAAARYRAECRLAVSRPIGMKVGLLYQTNPSYAESQITEQKKTTELDSVTV